MGLKLSPHSRVKAAGDPKRKSVVILTLQGKVCGILPLLFGNSFFLMSTGKLHFRKSRSSKTLIG